MVLFEDGVRTLKEEFDVAAEWPFVVVDDALLAFPEVAELLLLLLLLLLRLDLPPAKTLLKNI